MELSKKYKIIRLIILILFIISCAILLIEAWTPGLQSADKSNAVSDTIANVINNVSEAITNQPKITNLEEFRALIRKLVGHYGAFLIMGIFAALTGMMYYKRDKWFIFWIKALIIVVFGFLYAGLTEIIQAFTPGRYGVMTDVFIDFSGYMTSVGIVLIIYFIIFYKKFKDDYINNLSEKEVLESKQGE